MASVESHANDGVITKQMLKSKSGEFDLESIHTMSLKEMGIFDLGVVGECTGLERLDLSYNALTRLNKLASLTALTKLNLSANRLTSLDGLQSLENLQSLNVSGNLLGSVDVLRTVSNLEKLTDLRLQDQALGLTNPMCNTSYTDDVLIMLSHLITLDGQRVRGKGSELFKLCKEMDWALKNLPSLRSLDLKDNSSEIVVQQWVVDVTPKRDKVLDAEEQLTAMLASCKKLNEQAEQVLEDIKLSETNLS
ncbi:leucine-rich repeat-containing protein 61-like [Physella acuta]|uniref:leucine-rich repeat-containing protein 61-like n=1 Tax=Physella acuta TaxID=109671 RepID=UPI0027DD06BC|nr:leucine-rich repeat-containing protein 61-like [Physella acuta]